MERKEEDAEKKQSAELPPEAEDLTVFVQSVMEQMQSRFSQMSDAIIGRVDEMSARIDELEGSIQDLMVQAEIQAPDDSSVEGDATHGASPAATTTIATPDQGVSQAPAPSATTPKTDP